jgi:hypothetical protein
MFWGNEAYIIASGLHGLHLVKNLTPFAGFPCDEKCTIPENKCEKENPVTKAHSYVTRLVSYKLIRCKIYGGCLHSMNAPALVLEDP